MRSAPVISLGFLLPATAASAAVDVDAAVCAILGNFRRFEFVVDTDRLHRLKSHLIRKKNDKVAVAFAYRLPEKLRGIGH